MQPTEAQLLAAANLLKPRIKEVVLREAQSAYDASYPPENALAFQAWLAEALAEVPEDYRADAKVEFSAERGYEDDIQQCMKFYYSRPETEEEFAARVYERALMFVRQEAQERQQFERLQAKFGKS